MKSNMKIAQVVCVYPPYKGGIGRAAADFARVLSARDHKVVTFTPDYRFYGIDGEADGETTRLKTPVRFGNAAFLPQLFFRLKDFDLIFLHYPFFGTSEVVWLYRMFGDKKKKLAIYYHMDIVGLKPLFKIFTLPSKLIFNSLFGSAGRIMVSSFDYVRRGDLSEFYRRHKDKFRELPFGIDLEKFHPGEKDEKIFKIVFVGGLDRAHCFKGVDKLIDAVSIMNKRKGRSWRLDIVGDGDLRPDYEARAKSLGLADRIIFCGRADDERIGELYRRADVAILPSINKSEAFGIVLIEAMASGTAVIASDLAGVRTVFRDGREGFLVKPGDTEVLADKLDALRRDKAKAKRMGANARRLAEEKYNREKIGDRLEKFLKF